METFGAILYALCGLTSLGCTVLLYNRYRKSKVQLLFWSSAGFMLITLTNILLFIDRIVLPTSVDLLFVRTVVTLAGVMVMIYGLVSESTK